MRGPRADQVRRCLRADWLLVHRVRALRLLERALRSDTQRHWSNRQRRSLRSLRVVELCVRFVPELPLHQKDVGDRLRVSWLWVIFSFSAWRGYHCYWARLFRCLLIFSLLIVIYYVCVESKPLMKLER